MDDGDYEPNARVTPERLLASVLVALWVAIAWWEFGAILAMRATLFYAVVLSFIWIPELMARFYGERHFRDAGMQGMVAADVVRWLAWLLVLGLPTLWFLLSRVFNT